MALRSSPRSWALAAPTAGLGGVPGKSCWKGRDFPRVHLSVVPGELPWGNGLGAPWGPGCCMLRGCCGAWQVQHHGGSHTPPPQEGSVAGGRGSGWTQQVDAVDTVGCGRAGRWICNVGGGRREQDGSKPCPGPACNRGHGQEPRGGCQGRGVRPKSARGMVKREEGWHGAQRHSGQDQSADAERCRGRGERLGCATRHGQPGLRPGHWRWGRLGGPQGWGESYVH